MSRRPMVSAIIIFLNAEKFLQEAIESICAQTYPDWELLLVDDGSTDASTEIARRYATQRPGQVHYLEHPGHKNQGKGASRNLGIYHASGKYVAFLDADDVWLPQKLAEQVEILEQNPEAAVLYGNTLYWHGWTGKPEDKAQDFMPSLGVSPNTIYKSVDLLSRYLQGKAAVPCTCSIMLRRDLAVGVGGFETDFVGIYNVYEDQAFYAKICLKGPIYVSEKCWDKYRQHPRASMATALATGEDFIARRYYLNWLVGYLKEKGVTDRELWIALRKELWRNRHYRYPRQSRWTGRVDAIVSWVKKWCLRFEDRLLPISISARLWYPEDNSS